MNVNKYHKWYDQLIDRARTRTLTGYVERHHIVPKSLGGTNEASNLVRLTAREHLIAHMLLPKFVEDSAPMWSALWSMMNTRGLRTTSSIYEQARVEHAKAASEFHTGKPKPVVSRTLKGRKRPQEVSDKISAIRKARPVGCCNRPDGWVMPQKQRKALSLATKGKKKSAAHTAANSASHKGIKQSPETITKRVATFKARQAAGLIKPGHPKGMPWGEARKKAENNKHLKRLQTSLC